MLKLRAFRAIDEEDTCLRYMEGHARVLTDYGITNISTNNATWKDNPSVYGIIAEDEEGNALGGVRIHLTDGIYPLPVENAISDREPALGSILYSYPLNSAGELCGLWNARKIAGLGTSVLLVRALIAIASQLELTTIFTFCGRHTVYLAKLMGFHLEESIGEKGLVFYPTPQFASYLYYNSDIRELTETEEQNRNHILDLRKQPKQEATEVLYDLRLPAYYSMKEEKS
jgi:hypothetical protein